MKAMFLILALILVASGIIFRNVDMTPSIVIENPVVGIYPVEETDFKPSWTKGYEFLPQKKELREDGSILLTYQGTIPNTTLSFSSYKLDFNSLEKSPQGWQSQNATREFRIKNPQVTLNHLNKIEYDCYYPEVYQTTAYSKNLQPDGRVILSVQAEIKNLTYGIILPANYKFQSIVVKDDKFTAKKKS